MKKEHYIAILGIAALVVVFLIFSSKEKKVPEQKIQIQNDEQPVEVKPRKPALTDDSIPVMAEKEFQGSDLKLGKILASNESYTRYAITYKSEGLTISGIMNVPAGKGPFPVLILNHGFIEPKNYTVGQGLKREQDFLAKNGYVVLHSDYRNYGDSDYDPDNDVRPRSGYVEDVINAVSAVKNSDLVFFDKDNIGMLGHSMGGGIALNMMVTKPELTKACVLLAPINSNYKINFDKWVVPDPEFSGIAENFYQRYGTYQENPEFWESISAVNYFDKIQTPIMLHQGTLDDQVPVAWSQELAENLKNHGKEITYYEYSGEPHTFINAQQLVMQRTLEFFDKILKKQ